MEEEAIDRIRGVGVSTWKYARRGESVGFRRQVVLLTAAEWWWWCSVRRSSAIERALVITSEAWDRGKRELTTSLAVQGEKG